MICMKGEYLGHQARHSPPICVLCKKTQNNCIGSSDLYHVWLEFIKQQKIYKSGFATKDRTLLRNSHFIHMDAVQEQ